MILQCINICSADGINKNKTVVPIEEEEVTDDVEIASKYKPIVVANIEQVFAAASKDKRLSGILTGVVTSVKGANDSLKQITSLLAAPHKPSDFDAISRLLANIFEPILAGVNETRNPIGDSVIDIQHAIQSLIYVHLRNASADVIAKNVADVIGAVAQLSNTIKNVFSSCVLTIRTAHTDVAESSSAFVLILNVSIDIALQIVSKLSENIEHLPAKVSTIYKFAIESLSLAWTETDEIIGGIAAAISKASSAGLTRNVDSVLSDLIAVTSNLGGTLNVINIFVASYNIDTLKLSLPKDVSVAARDFSIVYKRFFGLIETTIKKLPKKVKLLEETSMNLAKAIANVVEFIINMKYADVAGEAIEKFSKTTEAHLKDLIEILNAFGSAIVNTPANRLNKAIAAQLQGIVSLTSYFVGYVNEFHTEVIEALGFVNVNSIVTDFLETFGKFIEDTEIEVKNKK